MAPEVSRTIRRVAFLLVALATAATEIAADEERSVAKSIGLASVFVLVAFVANRFIPLPANPKKKPPLWLFGILLALAVAPFVIEPYRRDWFGDGNPLELQMVFALKNVSLGLVAFAGWLLCLRLAVVTSLFLVLFATASTNHTAMMIVLGLYTTTGSVWLMLVYWTGLRSVFVASEKAAIVEVQPRANRTSWAGLGVLGLLLIASLAVIVVGPKRMTYALGELMPTSGGTGDTDPFARYGMGDGPEEAAGDNAQTAGMVDTERLIEDNRNSLIDAVGETYGPPHKPNQDQEKMVAAGLADVIQFHGKLPENRRPSRDFDTSRKGPQSNRTPESRGARAHFEVQGRTPLHVRLVAYENYDLKKKQWLEARRPTNLLLDEEGNDWMKLAQLREADWYADDERHQLKVADLKSNIVPTPSMLTRFRIKRVDKADYYEWDFEGVLAIAGRGRTPPGVIVTTDSRTIDPKNIPESAFIGGGIGKGSMPVFTAIPDEFRAEFDKLAREWVGDTSHGWRQIEAVLNKLRTEYTLDKEVAAPENHPAPVLWFLKESKRGPDYLFATAAAMILRSLDYPCRVCLGYYASPDAYDIKTSHTPVKSTDLHFWPEVRLRDGHWLVVEPTPGYEVLMPTKPLSERIITGLQGVAGWGWRHGIEFGLLFGLLAFVRIRRREIRDFVGVRLWALFPNKSWRERVRKAVHLLEQRGRWAGQTRPVQQTSIAWLRTAQHPSSNHRDDIDQLARMVEWAAYAPEISPPWSDDEVNAVCRNVLNQWTLQQWRKMPVNSGSGA